MAIQTGSATDHHDAMDKLRIFLVAQGWTVLRWNTAATLADQAELAVRPIGTGSFRPTITFKSVADVPNGFYHWVVSMATDFDAGLSNLAQPGSSSGFFTPLSNNPLTYWFYANDRRVICVFKIGTSYSNLYAGLFLPYALPVEYRRPFYVGGNHRSQQSISLANAANQYIANPGLSAAAFMDRADNWVTVNNCRDSTQAEPQYTSYTTRAYLWPKKVSYTDRTAQSGSKIAWSWWANEFMRPNAAGQMPLFQCHIMSPPENGNAGAIMGALDGVYDTGGFNRTAEQLVTFGGNNFRLFSNMYRTGNSQFMAIEEV